MPEIGKEFLAGIGLNAHPITYMQELWWSIMPFHYSEWLNVFGVGVTLTVFILIHISYSHLDKHWGFSQTANLSKKIPTWREICCLFQESSQAILHLRVPEAICVANGQRTWRKRIRQITNPDCWCLSHFWTLPAWIKCPYTWNRLCMSRESKPNLLLA